MTTHKRKKKCRINTCTCCVVSHRLVRNLSGDNLFCFPLSAPLCLGPPSSMGDQAFCLCSGPWRLDAPGVFRLPKSYLLDGRTPSPALLRPSAPREPPILPILRAHHAGRFTNPQSALSAWVFDFTTPSRLCPPGFSVITPPTPKCAQVFPLLPSPEPGQMFLPRSPAWLSTASTPPH